MVCSRATKLLVVEYVHYPAFGTAAKEAFGTAGRYCKTVLPGRISRHRSAQRVYVHTSLNTPGAPNTFRTVAEQVRVQFFHWHAVEVRMRRMFAVTPRKICGSATTERSVYQQ